MHKNGVHEHFAQLIKEFGDVMALSGLEVSDDLGKALVRGHESLPFDLLFD